jgi:hypothetical protein
MTDSNIGATGPPSVRLGGMKVENLPIAEAAGAKPQLPLVEEADKQTKADAIKARYPKHRASYLEGRIREAQHNIQKIRGFRTEQEHKKDEYLSEIALCKYRDQQITELTGEDRDEKRKLLMRKFPPYNVAAMQQQISQFEEACHRSDEVIQAEQESVAEMRELLVQVKNRDAELKNLGR